LFLHGLSLQLFKSEKGRIKSLSQIFFFFFNSIITYLAEGPCGVGKATTRKACLIPGETRGVVAAGTAGTDVDSFAVLANEAHLANALVFAACQWRALTTLVAVLCVARVDEDLAVLACK
jgi:hypothetical protein